jgi:hypothetical protein
MGATVPDMKGMPDALAPQDFTEVTVVVEEWILAPDHQNDVHPAQGIETPSIQTR